MHVLEQVDLTFFQAAPVVVRNQVLVAAPRPRVFAAIAGDPAAWGEWFPGFGFDGRWETPGPHGTGSVRTVRAYRARYRETVLAWDTDERWAFRVDESGSPLFRAFAEDYRLSDHGTGTRLGWTVAYRPGLVMRLAAPFAAKGFASVLRRAGAGLERVCTGA